jgi:hypothetical protein
MAENFADRTPSGLTVGSLIGQPQGRDAGTLLGRGMSSALPGGGEAPSGEQESSAWQFVGGHIRTGGVTAGYSEKGVERLDYNNPFSQNMERVWFDGRLVFALDVGEIDVDPATVKVAQEYQIVYGVELNEQGKKIGEPEQVPGQLNIYDSVPGMAKYSPIWQFNYVVVPRAYEANSLKSEADCLNSGFPIKRSNDFEN